MKVEKKVKLTDAQVAWIVAQGGHARLTSGGVTVTLWPDGRAEVEVMEQDADLLLAEIVRMASEG